MDVSDPSALERRRPRADAGRRSLRLGGKFEIAPPGKPEEFKTYLERTAKRKAS
jgi:hypothetical protein